MIASATGQEAPTNAAAFDPLYEILGGHTIAARDGTKWSKELSSRRGIKKRKRDSDMYQPRPTPNIETVSTLSEILGLFLEGQMLSNIVSHTYTFIMDI